MKILTLQRILATHPCLEQRKILVREFPEGIPLTEEGLERVLATNLDVTWGRYFLIFERLPEYRSITNQAYAEYYRVKDQALTEYYSSIDQALAKHIHVTPQAWDEYNCARDQAQAEYKRITNQAAVEYRRTISTWLIENIT